MAALTAFAKYVRPSVPGCPEPVLLDAILRACIEYASRTKFLQETITVNTAIGATAYTLATGTGTEPIEIRSIKRDTTGLNPSGRYDVDAEGLDLSEGTPTDFYLESDGSMIIYPAPDAAEALLVKVAVAPTNSATTVSDAFLVAGRIDKIAAGAKAILMLMPNTPWSNTQDAAIQVGIMEAAIALETLKQAKGGTRRVLRTKASYF
jgi:hypothetical protein